MKHYKSLADILLWKTTTLILFAIHLTVVLFFVHRNQPWTTGDSSIYLRLAANLRAGSGFGLISGDGVFEPEGLRDIGYPAFIVLCQTVTSSERLGVVIFQCLFFFASVWLIWKVTENLFNKLTAQIFLAISAAYPFIGFSASQISPEIITVFLISAAAFFLLKSENLTNVFLAALCVSLTAYFRANLILLGLFAAVVFALFPVRRIRYSLIFAGAAVLIAAPNVWRNYQVFGSLKPIPVYSATGHSLLAATWQSKISTRSIVNYAMSGEISEEMKQAGLVEQIRAINQQVGAPPETIVTTPETYLSNELKIRASAASYAAAVENIKQSPFAYLKSSVTNFFRLWFSANFPETIHPAVRFFLLLQGVAAFVVGLAGLILTFFSAAKINPAGVFAMAVIIYLPVTLCWLHTEARYTITARLLLLMFAAQAVHWLAGKMSGDRIKNQSGAAARRPERLNEKKRAPRF